LKDNQEQRRKQQVHSRMQVLLFRHKELLKKDILKKRALLEKELQIDIQVCINMSSIYDQIMMKHDM